MTRKNEDSRHVPPLAASPLDDPVPSHGSVGGRQAAPPSREWTIYPDGPDGRVPHFYADGNEQPVTVIPKPDEAAVERAAGKLWPMLLALGDTDARRRAHDMAHAALTAALTPDREGQ